MNPSTPRLHKGHKAVSYPANAGVVRLEPLGLAESSHLSESETQRKFTASRAFLKGEVEPVAAA